MAMFPKEVLIEYVLDGEDNADCDIEFVESGPWEDEGKYSFRQCIFKSGGKFYAVDDSRSGSYFSSYEYGHNDWDAMVECDEVEKVAITKYEWRPVKKG